MGDVISNAFEESIMIMSTSYFCLEILMGPVL